MRHRIFPRSTGCASLVTHVGQHRAPQLAFVQAKGKFRQIAGKRFHVMVVVAGILAQIVARQLTRRPCPVEWMAEQIVLCYHCIQLLEELCANHDGLLVLTV